MSTIITGEQRKTTRLVIPGKAASSLAKRKTPREARSVCGVREQCTERLLSYTEFFKHNKSSILLGLSDSYFGMPYPKLKTVSVK